MLRGQWRASDSESAGGFFRSRARGGLQAHSRFLRTVVFRAADRPRAWTGRPGVRHALCRESATPEIRIPRALFGRAPRRHQGRAAAIELKVKAAVLLQHLSLVVPCKRDP